MKATSSIPLLILLVLLLSACHHEQQPVQNDEKIGYSSATFSPTQQYKTHQVAAFVVPTDQASLSFQVSGIIEEQFIKIGDQVEPGPALIQSGQPFTWNHRSQQFKSQIEAIEATMEQNECRGTKRVKNLKKTNAISQNELDRLTNQQDNLKATQKEHRGATASSTVSV